MHIALVTSIAYSVVNFRGPLIEALVQRGATVSAMAPDWDNEQRRHVRDLSAEAVDIPLDRAGIKPLRDLINSVKLWRILKRRKPDAVLNYFAKPVIFGTLAAWLAGVPRRVALIEGLGYVFIREDTDTLGRKLLRFITSWLYRIALTRAHCVVFLNHDDANEFEAMRIVDKRKVVVLGGIGVDLTKLLPSPPPTDPVTFLMMARLLKEKGVREYAAAAQLVKKNYPDTRFILLGNRDANPGSVTLEELQGWAADGRLEWPGHVDDVTDWVKAASIFVLPSFYREGVPRSSQEAAALGRAVITTDSIGCRETVIDGETGFLVPVRSAEALAEAMMRFIRDPALVGSMGTASRALAEERFDVHRWNSRMIDLLLPTPSGKA